MRLATVRQISLMFILTCTLFGVSTSNCQKMFKKKPKTMDQCL